VATRLGSRPLAIRWRSLSRHLQRALRKRRIDVDIDREERELERFSIDENTKAVGLMKLRREHERGDHY